MIEINALGTVRPGKVPDMLPWLTRLGLSAQAPASDSAANSSTPHSGERSGSIGIMISWQAKSSCLPLLHLPAPLESSDHDGAWVRRDIGPETGVPRVWLA